MAPSFARLACALVFLAVVVDAMPNPTIYDAWFYAASAVAQAGFTKYFLSVFFERHAWVYCGYTWASVTWVIAIIHFVIAHYEKQVKVQAKSIRNLRLRKLGDVQVTVLGCGGASLGDLYVETPHAQALGTLECALQGGIKFFDTAPFYGLGLSEARFGLGLLRTPRKDFIFNTKVGRSLVPDRECRNAEPFGWKHGSHFAPVFDYSGAGIRKQHSESLQRTGLGRIDTLVIHDLEPGAHRSDADVKGVATAKKHLAVLRESGFDELCAMRAKGTIAAFGAGVNSDEDGEDAAAKLEYDQDYVQALFKMGDSRPDKKGLDFLLLANMYSLLNLDAHTSGILDECLRRDVQVVIGGPFSSGILATGADPKDGGTAHYNYRPARKEVLDRCRGIERVCKKHKVPLIAAALQFPLGHPAVATVIPGAKSPAEVQSNLDNLRFHVPAAFWADLKAEKLLPKDARAP